MAHRLPVESEPRRGGKAMRRKAMIILAALATAAAGCHKDDAKNDALQTDLNLANQANSARSLDSISAAERGYASPSATSPRTSTSSTTRSSSTARRTSSSSNGSVSPAPAPSRTVTQKNTKRDAAI